MDSVENPFGQPPLKAALSALKGVAWATIGMSGLIGAGVIKIAHDDAAILDRAFQFTSAAPAQTSTRATITSFGPFHEDQSARISITPAAAHHAPGTLIAQALLSKMEPSLGAIRSNAMQLNAAMEICKRQEPDCIPEVRQYQDMIEKVRQIPDRLTQAKTINAWVNTAILYDHGMRARAVAKLPHVWPTPLGSLTSGSGVCDQQAELKLHALSKVGFAQDDLRFTVLMLVQEGKWASSHGVVLARIDGKNYVLNNQTTEKEVKPFHRDYLPLEDTGRTLDYNAALQSPAQLLNLGLDASFRQEGASMIPLYSMNYQSAQPYIGVTDNAEPPYYRGVKFDRPLLQLHWGRESLGHNLSDVAAPHRPVVFAVLDPVINRYAQPDPRTDTITMPAMVIRGNQGLKPERKQSPRAPAP